jgi:hypothetical protein
MIASFDIGEKNFAFSIGTSSKLYKFEHVNILKRKRQTITESCDYISQILFKEDWSICNKVIIEQQVLANIRMQRCAQHVWSWFKLLKPELNPEFVKSSLKTQYFLGKNNLTNSGRKKWSVQFVLNLLKESNDFENYEKIQNLNKKDDVTDTWLQLIAFSKMS